MQGRSGQASTIAVLDTAWPWTGRGSVVLALGWLLSLPRRWWVAWPEVAGRLAADPRTFVNHR